MQSGELIVIGSNHIDIPLHKFPCETRVYFKDHLHDPIPCNPGSVDFLECEVHTSNLHLSRFILRITWSVSGVREIVWRVCY